MKDKESFKKTYRCIACGFTKRMTPYGRYPSVTEHLRKHHLSGVPAAMIEVK